MQYIEKKISNMVGLKMDQLKFRNDAIQRINKGTSPSMKLRNVLYEKFSVLPNKSEYKSFDDYYCQVMNMLTRQFLEEAVKMAEFI